MMELGLFENPYVDPDKAQQVADDPVSQAKADGAHRKSIVLLRNDQDTLPLKDENVENIKLYVEVFSSGTSGSTRTADLKKSITQYDPSIQVVDNLAEATHALVYAIPNTVPDRPDIPLSVALNAETGINVERIKEIEAKVPTILKVNMTSPWLIGEIEENAAATLAVFGVKAEALVDVIRGKFAPTGKLPFTIPANQEAVDNNNGDVPGYDEDPSYVYRDKNGNA
jgi:beta-glucosidase